MEGSAMIPPPVIHPVPGADARVRLHQPGRVRLVVTVEGDSPMQALTAAQWALVQMSRDRPGAYRLTRVKR